jgi:Metallo-peptidase family M12B Reprolysin-like
MGTSSSPTSAVTTKLTSNAVLDSLLDGNHWASNSITYSFTSPGVSTYLPDYQDISFWQVTQAFNSAQQLGTQNALAAWSNVANLNFTQVPDNQTSAGTLRFTFSSSHIWGNSCGAAYTPTSNPAGGDVFLNPSAQDSLPGSGFANGTFAASTFTLGVFSYNALIHELGHALGLKHPFSNSTDGGGQSIVGTTSSDWDSCVYTVMSYTTDSSHPDAIGFTFNPTTPMLLDIQAIQSIYGANNTFNSGNTNYPFNDNAEQYYFQTIWDGGGVNTITYTGSTSSNIDLRQGYGSTIGNKVYDYTATNNKAYTVPNLWIAYGTIIDNFVAVGNANVTIQCNDDGDTVTCNAGNVTVNGGTGNDKIIVGTGSATIKGGGGTDTVVFAFPSTNYNISTVSGTTTISSKTAGQGTEVLTSIASVQFSDKTLNLITPTPTPTPSPTTATTQGKLFLVLNASFLVQDNLYVSGIGNNDTIRIAGSPNAQLDANINTVVFDKTLSNYKFNISGTTIAIVDSTFNPVISFASLNQTVKMVFSDGAASLQLTGIGMASLGTSTLTSSTPVVLSPTLDATVKTSSFAASTLPVGKLFLANNATVTVTDSVSVIGATGYQTVNINGAQNVTIDANVQQTNLNLPLSSVYFSVNGTQIKLSSDASGQNPIVSYSGLNAAEKLVFADGSSQSLQLTGLGAASLGNVNFGSTPVKITPVNAIVKVSSAGTLSGANGATTFVFATGNYTETITGFKAVDAIKFDWLNDAISIINASGSDGNLTIVCNDPSNGNQVTVQLTGIAIAQDSSIFNVASFNSTSGFGAGSLS